MYFTLIPVAALLLMLVGVGMPAHAAVPGQTAESRMRALLGLEAGSDANADAHPTRDELRAERTAPLAAQSSVILHERASHLAFVWQMVTHASKAAAAPGAFEVKQYRTRFGVPGGAYLAAGPPPMAA